MSRLRLLPRVPVARHRHQRQPAARILTAGSNPQPPTVDHTVIERARTTLTAHHPGDDGLCRGCEDLGQFALTPCPTARDALDVLTHHLPAQYGEARSSRPL
jgi:hypothetical protein